MKTAAPHYRNLPFCLAVLIGAAACLEAQAPPGAQPGFAGPGSIAAIVGQEVITHGELEKRLKEYLAAFRATEPVDQGIIEQILPRWRSDLLTNLIEKSLLTQEAKRLSIAVDDAMIDRRINQEIEDLQKRGYAIRNSDEYYRTILETQRVSKEEYRKEIQLSILIEALMWTRVYRSREFIPPGERREYYQHHLKEFQTPSELIFRQIFVERGPDSEEILKAIDQGLEDKVPFEVLAKQYSKTRRAEGGLYEKTFAEISGWVHPLPDVLKKMSPGEISPRIVSTQGFHYFKMEEIKLGNTRPFEEAQEDIERKIRAQRNMEDKNNFVEELKKRYVVQRFLPELARTRDKAPALKETAKKKDPAKEPDASAGKIQDVSPDPGNKAGAGKDAKKEPGERPEDKSGGTPEKPGEK